MNKTEKKHIAFIYEGVSAEDKLLANMQKIYFSEFSDVYIFNLPFDNETEQGKLYVSYPMVESIKEINVKEVTYNRLYLMLEDIQDYKNSFEGQTDYGNYSIITKEMWRTACLASVKRASLIVRNTEQCTYEQFIQQVTQLEIYHAEKQYYINNPNGYYLAILNSVPLFLIEYFNEEFYENCICA